MSSLLAATAMAPADIFRLQDEALRTQQYDAIGKVKCIVLEAAKDAATPPSATTRVLGVRMDWMDGGPRGVNYPVLAKTRGGQLMILGAVPPLPDMAPPDWKPKWGTRFDKAGKVEYERPELVKQPFNQYLRGHLSGTPYNIFGPVMQILVHPEGIETYWIVEAKADPGTGTMMDFVIDIKTGRGYFFGGLFSIHQY